MGRLVAQTDDNGNERWRRERLEWLLDGGDKGKGKRLAAAVGRRFQIRDRRDRVVWRCVEETEEAVTETIG